MRILLTLALLTVFPLVLFADQGNVNVQGRVLLRANVDVPFSADAPIPGPPATQFNDAPPAPGPVTTHPAPAYQYEQAPTYEYTPTYQTRVRYRLRVQPARFYYQPVVSYEPTMPVLFGDPCLTGLGGGFLGARRERLDIRYRYRSGW